MNGNITIDQDVGSNLGEVSGVDIASAKNVRISQREWGRMAHNVSDVTELAQLLMGRLDRTEDQVLRKISALEGHVKNEIGEIRRDVSDLRAEVKRRGRFHLGGAIAWAIAYMIFIALDWLLISDIRSSLDIPGVTAGLFVFAMRSILGGAFIYGIFFIARGD